MSIFQEILDTRSFTIIEYMIADALDFANDCERETLLKMSQAKELDEIYALAYEKLGNTEQAKSLRDWMASKSNKRQAMPEQLLTN